MKPAFRTLLVAVALLLAIAATGRAAPADGARPRPEDEQARQAFVRGEQLFRSQKYTEAAASFEEGHRLSPSPAFLYDLALTYRALNNPQQAISYYQAYLKAQPNASDRSTVEAAIADEQRKLAKAPPAPSRRLNKTSFEPATTATAAAAPAKEAAPTVEKEPDVLLTKSDHPVETPVYKKWWFWTATGAVVVGAVAIGLGVGLSKTGTEPYREVTWR